jgi:hypothetical protein
MSFPIRKIGMLKMPKIAMLSTNSYPVPVRLLVLYNFDILPNHTKKVIDPLFL